MEESPMFRHPLRAAVAAIVLLVGLTVARPALAGPPLLCHPFNIEGARSLPWNDTGEWLQGRTDYDLKSLVADTDALLTSSTPVIVRMETLRRAAIYASRDRDVAGRLLSSLTERVKDAGTAPRARSLALLDLAYVTEALREITYLDGKPEFHGSAQRIKPLIADSDGYAMAKASLAAQPDEPALEFAVALIAADRDRAGYEAHAARAKAGAKRDHLLSLNIGQIS
jgi:hypothetical protein